MHPHSVRFFDESQQQSFEKGLEKGLARARAEDVIVVLDARNVAVSDEQRERILACTDLSLLDRWLRQAVTIARSEELFATGT